MAVFQLNDTKVSYIAARPLKTASLHMKWNKRFNSMGHTTKVPSATILEDKK